MSDTRDPEQLRAEAAQMRQQARELEIRADLRDAEAAAIERLRARHRGDTIRTMTDAARAHISAGVSKQTGRLDPLIEAANKVNHTLRSLSAAVVQETGKPCPQSIITRARQGTRRIRPSAARVIEALTGFKATPAHWPGGWASED